MRRNLSLAAILLLVWAGWYGWQDWKLKRELNRLADVVRSSELDRLLTDPPEDIRSNVDLAVRGISLMQGRDGRKSFELRADWATLDEKTRDITMRDPDVLYTLEAKEGGGQERLVHAVSRIGRVEDGAARISMSGQVKADSGGNSLSSDEAVYISRDRILDFPVGANLSGDGIEGEASHLAWNLLDNTISGDRGVRIRWYPEEDSLAAPDEEARETLPSDSTGPGPARNDHPSLSEEQS